MNKNLRKSAKTSKKNFFETFSFVIIGLVFASSLMITQGYCDDNVIASPHPKDKKVKKIKKVIEFIEVNHILTQFSYDYPGLEDYYLDITYPFSSQGLDVPERFPNGALLDNVDLGLAINGTYIDAPMHCLEGGHDISEWPLEKLVNIPVVVVSKPTRTDERGTVYYDTPDFQDIDVSGKAVLLSTGHDEYWMTPDYGTNPPYLSVSGALYLVDHGAVIVGIESPLIDDHLNSAEDIPVHKILLGNGVVVAEDMTNLQSIPEKDAYLTIVPPRVTVASFPTRAFVTVYK